MTKIVPPVLSIDWFQIHCISLNKKDDLIWHLFFKVKKMEYGTRHFSLVEELYSDRKRIATVTRKPCSPMLDKSMILIKFDNWILYSKNLSTWVPWFLAINALEFKNISRVDICTDFNYFPNGQEPAVFMKKFLHDTILKTGKLKKGSGHYEQNGNCKRWTGMRFGSLYSEISYYLYDKTLEMKEKTFKPWIHKLWVKSGLDINLPIYRLEFTVKSSGKIICNTDSGEVKMLNSMDILKRHMSEVTYNVLLNRFWQFVWNDGQVKKGRMRRLRLFPEKFAQYSLIESEGLHDSTRSTKIFIKMLEQTNTELRGRSFDLAIAAHDLKVEMIVSRGLQQWATYKNLF
jgi:hypothetical protein